MQTAFGGLTLIVMLLGIVLSVLWIFVPFAIFGQKRLQRTLIAEQRRTNALLEAMARQRGVGVEALVATPAEEESPTLMDAIREARRP